MYRQQRMEAMKRCLSLAALALVAVALVAQTSDIPAFHSKPPAKNEQQPPIWGKEKLLILGFTQPVQIHAYQLASKIPNVLYQLPCYCRCDRAEGHTSLRSCFTDDHGARCGTCMAEAYYAYKMTKAGKTPAQIRALIEKGEWQKLDLKTAVDIN